MLVGFYICYDGMNYSGNGRHDFSIKDWGYPGEDMFRSRRSRVKDFVFLFDEPDTHTWEDWSLLARDPEAEYKSYLKF